MNGEKVQYLSREKDFRCRLTGVLGRPVKCHVIPKAFYDIPDQREGVYRQYSNTPECFSKRIPKGVYDKGIVTNKGENILASFDDYAAMLLLGEFDKAKPLHQGDELIAWLLEDYNFKLLMKFVLSVLWRMHSSNWESYKKICLSEEEEKSIRDFLLDEDGLDAGNYSVVIARWNDEYGEGKEFGPVFLDSHEEQDGGFRIYCGHYIFYIKNVSEPIPKELAHAQVSPGKPLVVLARKLRQSKEWKVMKNIARGRPKG